MFWVPVSVIVVLCLTGLALIEADRFRRKRLERKMKVELVNLGNVDCRFQLRAEDPNGGLAFQFMQNGARLSEWQEDARGNPLVLTGQPAVRPAQTAAQVQASPAMAAVKPAAAGQNVQKVMTAGSVLSAFMTSLGAILPGTSGSKVMQAGSQLARTESKAVRIQQVAGQAATLKPAMQGTPAQTGANGAESGSTTVAPQPVYSGPVVTWAETPIVQPGKTTIVDLVIRSIWIKHNAARPFQIMSRASVKGQSPLVVEDGIVQVLGGFWSHRVYPKLTIIILAVMALALIARLAYLGMLV